MNVIIKQATIIDPQSLYHLQTVDIKITNGIIEAIDKSITNNTNKLQQTINNKNDAHEK
jgi:dihydroorotase